MKNENAYLLTWNPYKFTWPNFIEYHTEFINNASNQWSWSCGGRKYLDANSLIFLMKLGPLNEYNKGLVASGRSIEEPKLERHWSKNRSKTQPQTLYVTVEWDFLSCDPLITLPELKKLGKFNWTPQSSGVKIPEKIVELLKRRWRKEIINRTRRS